MPMHWLTPQPQGLSTPEGSCDQREDRAPLSSKRPKIAQ
ncbi:hypothetical protein KPSA1_05775 [Pseudomonas syringae pv. actinidiae]|uniref:Uncharacterized protein n=1 Tax=Pseudomonas syringae pv. actinidiae TaxID=103796 RepID=A0A2V0QUK8_PSESF|nr:hypothetical protein KPSA1_05775 [Pseudomonas syringae pv. actinidiae]